MKKLSSREQDIKVRLENLYLQKSAFDQELDALNVRKKNLATLVIANVCFRKHMFDSKMAFFRWYQTSQFFQSRDLLEEKTRVATETAAQLSAMEERCACHCYTSLAQVGADAHRYGVASRLLKRGVELRAAIVADVE